jgi:hypothetical protein
MYTSPRSAPSADACTTTSLSISCAPAENVVSTGMNVRGDAAEAGPAVAVELDGDVPVLDTDGERIREPGILDGFEVAPQDAEMLIMRARVAAGWISEEDLPQVEEPEAEAEEFSEEEAEAAVDELDLAALEAEAERLGVDLSTLLEEGPDMTNEAGEEAFAGEEDDEEK